MHRDQNRQAEVSNQLPLKQNRPSSFTAPSYDLRYFRKIIDASSDLCPIHPQRYCYGRLCHRDVGGSREECNLRVVEFFADKLAYSRLEPFRRLLLVAKREIKPYEKLCFSSAEFNSAATIVDTL